MLVLDASAFVEVLTAPDSPRRRELFVDLDRDAHWVVPEHFRLEVANALRGLVLAGALSNDDLSAIFVRLAEQPFDVWPTAPLLPRILELAHNVTAYDAAYLALAEDLGGPLVTMDRKFGRVPGIRCRVITPGR